MPRATKEATTSRAVTAFRYQPTANPYDQLPFVIAPVKGEGRTFWAPRPTGDYNFDCGLGAEYADAAIAMLRDDDHLLGYIALGILERGDKAADRGIIVGFMLRLSQRLIVGPARQLAAVQAWAAVPG